MLANSWACICGKLNLARDNNCPRCGGDRALTEKPPQEEEPMTREQRQWLNRRTWWHERFLRAGTTPYGVDNDCLIKRARSRLGMASAILRRKGHREIADYVDAELDRIQSTPDLETDMDNYMIALMDQLYLSRRISAYASEHGLIEEILPHLDVWRDDMPRVPS